MKNMVVPFFVKNIDTEADHYIFKGYASTFGNTDLGQDKVIKGAFAKTLEEIKREGRTVPILWQHNTHEPVGVFSHLSEDDKGLYVEGKMPKDDSFVRDRVLPQMKIGSIGRLSIGYGIKENGAVWKNGVHELKDLDLFETSLVTFPMNPKAVVIEVKSLLSLDERELEGLLISGTPLSNKLAKKFVSAVKAAGMLRDEQDDHRDDDEATLKEIYQLLQEFK